MRLILGLLHRHFGICTCIHRLPSFRYWAPCDAFEWLYKMADVANTSGQISSKIEDIPSRVMLWSEEEAALKQIEQVGVSACGATAALNVLGVLGMTAEVPDVVKAVRTRLRDLEAPLPKYLLSRSVAGTTHTDIIDGIKEISNGNITGRFFNFYPERDVDICLWLKTWLLRGGIPVATLNCQKVPYPDGTIPDAWHHQMIWGVSEDGIHAANPCLIIPEKELMTQLCSESVLLIRRSDVLERWNVNMDETPIETNDWARLQVVQQIERIIKEEMLKILYGNELKDNGMTTSHVVIPAAYKSGITIFVKKGSIASDFLDTEGEIPIKNKG